MTLDVKESEIVEAVYESNQTWVSVEATLDYELDPTDIISCNRRLCRRPFLFQEK
jgi:menaquinone-specific isochorismate synthase